MPSVTVENYLKHIYTRQQEHDGHLVPMGKLASAMSVTPGTATAMMKTLSDARLVDYEPRGGVRLTDAGSKLALQVLRRHRLIELFLVEVLGLDWSEVHDEAEHLEHALSDKVLDRIDALLGHPDADPHGDPIPPRNGRPPRQEVTNLVDCAVNEPLRIARVMDQDQAFLQFAHQHGLTPGADVVVAERNPAADAVTLHRADDEAVTLGAAAAAKIMVTSVKEDSPQPHR